MEKVKILIDTKGGDNGASVMIKGAALALEKFDALSYVLIGDEDVIRTECEALSIPMDRVEIIDEIGRAHV